MPKASKKVVTMKPSSYKARTRPGRRYDEEAIRLQISRALRDNKYRENVAFHMTDWLGDLREWHKFCRHPQSLKPKEVRKLLMSFLIHVPNHLAAAGKLVMGEPVVADIFEVGALD